MSMYTGGVRKKITKTMRKTYDQMSARLRSWRMLRGRRLVPAATVADVIASALRASFADVAQNEDCRDRQDREHEQRHAGAERNVVALDADAKCPGGEHVRLIDGPAVG